MCNKGLNRGRSGKMIIVILSLAANLGFCGGIKAQAPARWSNIIGSAYQGNKSYDFLERICDEAGGRPAGSEANEKAVGILIEELGRLGLKAEKESFRMNGWTRQEDEVAMISPVKKKLQALALGYTDSTAPFTAGLTDAGFGLEDDYKGLDVNGRIVFVTQEKPPGQDQPLRYEVIETAARHGARAVLFMNEKIGHLNLAGVTNFQGRASAVPAFSITFEEGQWMRRLMNKGITPWISIIVRSYCREHESMNVRLTFPGKTPGRIVIGAHFDSWDMGQGAVDNGQGSAVLFDVARLINQCSRENYYTVELVWLNAEELGLWGSKKYMDKHKNDSIMAMINMDMPGTPTGFNAMGFDGFLPFLNGLVAGLDGFNMSAGVSSQPWTNSDHMYFMFAGIPTFTLNGFLDKDMYWYYHDAGDSFDKVNKKYLSDAAAIVTILGTELANRPDLPYKRLTEKEVADMLKKFKLDDRLKRQKEWHFGE